MSTISWLDNLVKNPQTLLHLFEIISNMTGQKKIKEALAKAQEAVKKGDISGAKKALGGFDIDSYIDEIYYQNSLAGFSKIQQKYVDLLMYELKKSDPEIHRGVIACIATNEVAMRKNMIEAILGCKNPEDLKQLAIARGWDRPDSPKTTEKILNLLKEHKGDFSGTKDTVVKGVKDAQQAANDFITSCEEVIINPLEDFLTKLKNW